MRVTDDGKEVNEKKVKGCTAKEHQEEVRAKVKEEKWQGEMMISNSWEDVHLEQGDCFAWLSCWKAAPTYMWLLLYKNFTDSYFQERFSIIGRRGQVAAESKGVERMERQQRVSHIS